MSNSAVEGLIEMGDLVAIVGPAKSGKTLLALALARAISTGTPFLGRPTRKWDVVFMPGCDRTDRIERLLNGTAVQIVEPDMPAPSAPVMIFDGRPGDDSLLRIPLLGHTVVGVFNGATSAMVSASCDVLMTMRPSATADFPVLLVQPRGYAPVEFTNMQIANALGAR